MQVDIINDLFITYKDAPPIKNQPPVAGAIGWSRSLFKRIKKTVLRFQTMKELIDSSRKYVLRKYYSLYLYIYSICTHVKVETNTRYLLGYIDSIRMCGE